MNRSSSFCSRAKSQAIPAKVLYFLVLLSTPFTVMSASAEPGKAPSTDPDQGQERSILNPLSWKWTPSDEEIRKYRQSWNPMANGPILLTSVDISPKGQFLSQFFVFGETGHQSFDNKLTTNRTDSPTHLNAIAPFLVGYGLTDHVEINVAPTAIYWQANQMTAGGGRERSDEVGLGDTAVYLFSMMNAGSGTISSFSHCILSLAVSTAIQSTSSPAVRPCSASSRPSSTNSARVPRALSSSARSGFSSRLRAKTTSPRSIRISRFTITGAARAKSSCASSD
jgi:hypothetical protein